MLSVRLPLVKKSRLVFTPAPALTNDAAGKRDDAPEVAVVEELALGLDEGVFVRAEQHALVDHHAASAAVGLSCR